MNDYEVYVSLELAMMLKEAGFDWEIKTFYFMGELSETMLGEAKNHNFSDQFVSAPTLYVAQKWLREVKNVLIEVQIFPDDCAKDVKYGVNIVNSYIATPDLYKTYEEALVEGIIVALKEELKNKTK